MKLFTVETGVSYEDCGGCLDVAFSREEAERKLELAKRDFGGKWILNDLNAEIEWEQGNRYLKICELDTPLTVWMVCFGANYDGGMVQHVCGTKEKALERAKEMMNDHSHKHWYRVSTKEDEEEKNFIEWETDHDLYVQIRGKEIES